MECREKTTTKGSYASAVKAWGAEMQSLTKKPVVLYSGAYFYSAYIGTKAHYDDFWVASYSSARPAGSYGLWQYTDRLYVPALGLSVDASKVITTKFGNYFGKQSTSKYVHGGRKVNEVVRVKKGSKFYGTSETISSAVASKNLRIKQVKATNTGTSKQIVLVYNGDTVIGWVRAQDVNAYYHTSAVHKLKTKGTIFTYHGTKRASKVKKGTTLKVSGFTKTASGVYTAKHAGHKTTFTANKDCVKKVG